ncbi:hypothetical protein KM043_009027 [Ampulex compressa]|nr:hypothetical protein KM043_009027 [Ampulex compressa]
MEAIGCGLYAANILENIPDGLQNCDILIYLDALVREDCESIDSWLNRNYKSMEKFSQYVNQYAPPHMKIIFCSSGATCFCVNVMHALVKNLPKANIVAVGSHYGLEIIYPFINAVDLDLTEFGCPPVWGFLGVNRYVDLSHMTQKHNVLRPNKKALKATAQYQVGRMEHFQMCRAICDLLKLWFDKKSEIGDEIISLGISSNGSFGIPEGLVFSQPVYLTVTEDNTRVWLPFANFPLPDIPKELFENLIHTAMLITKRLIENSDRTHTKNVFN